MTDHNISGLAKKASIRMPDDPRNNPLLAPGSAVYRIFSDLGTVSYAGMAAMVLGTLQPQAGQGVKDHDFVFKKPSIGMALRRLQDSYELVAGILLGPTAEDRRAAAFAMRELHRVIQGRMPDGSRYMAWQREVWAYAWLGIFKGIMEAYEFSRGFRSQAEREEALAGFIALGKVFSVEGIPEQWDEFNAYWNHYLTDVCKSNPTVEFIMSQLGPNVLKPKNGQKIPGPLWRLITLPMRHLLYIGALATFPPVLDKELNIQRSALNKFELLLHKIFWRLIPRKLTEQVGPAFFRIRKNTVWKKRFSYENLDTRRTSFEAHRAELKAMPTDGVSATDYKTASSPS